MSNNQNRAYSILTINKAFTDQNTGKRIVRGIATTPAPDRVGDIVEPLGCIFAEVIPFLWQHDHSKPIGTVKLGKVTAAGIEFEAEIAVIDEPGTLKDRCDEAYQSIKAGLVMAVSIGFRVLDGAVEKMKNGGLRFLKSEIFELSAVTIPANQQATISVVKSIDQEQRAASGIVEDNDQVEAEEVETPEIEVEHMPRLAEVEEEKQKAIQRNRNIITIKRLLAGR